MDLFYTQNVVAIVYLSYPIAVLKKSFFQRKSSKLGTLKEAILFDYEEIARHVPKGIVSRDFLPTFLLFKFSCMNQIC